ncbi:MAG: KTSC domain-containing protein [Pirellulaceae bacterium]|nr:KTSC domain-containing protein [Pirellulaceae bacterium]
MLKWHPDRCHGDSENQTIANKRAAAINAAFERLSRLLAIGPVSRYEPSSNADPVSRPSPTRQKRPARTRKTFAPSIDNLDVDEVFVESSHIVSIGYSQSTETLYIRFTNNSVYAYLDVPEDVFVDFLAAESHGRFAHRHIYRQYVSVCC